MKIQKLTQACLIIDNGSAKIAVDPGEMTPEFSASVDDNFAAVVFTHNHFDHYSAKNLRALFAKNPKIEVFASTQTFAKIREDFPSADFAKIHAVVSLKTFDIGGFELAFFGARHAHIIDGDDRGDNIGVVVSDDSESLVYPGDSFDLPNEIKFRENYILALPTSGPWLKIGESVAYLREISRKFGAPKYFFPTHDALNNASANKIAKTYLDAEEENLKK